MRGCSALQATKIHRHCYDLLHLHLELKSRGASQLRATSGPESQMPKQLPPAGGRHGRCRGPADPWLVANNSYSTLMRTWMRLS